MVFKNSAREIDQTAAVFIQQLWFADAGRGQAWAERQELL
jgi:hypothetical protein